MKTPGPVSADTPPAVARLRAGEDDEPHSGTPDVAGTLVAETFIPRGSSNIAAVSYDPDAEKLTGGVRERRRVRLL